MNTLNFNISTFSQEHVKKFMFVVTLLTLAALLMAMPEQAYATTSGTGADDFDSIWQRLQGWTQGTLGKVIAGSMVIVGIVMGIARQSLMAFAVGTGGGMGLSYSPDIIEAVFGSTLAHIDSAAAAAIVLSNGMGL